MSDTYDRLNRLLTVAEPAPEGPIGVSTTVTEFRYDRLGNVTAVIDPLDRMTVYHYHAANRRIAAILPDVDQNLTGVPTWRNPVNRYDVNADGTIDDLDVAALDDFGTVTTLQALARDRTPSP